MTVQSDYFRQNDEAELLTLTGLEYGVDVPDAKIENFHWRYKDNPSGRATISVIREASAQKVVGFVWLLPLHMQTFGQRKLGAFMTNLIIKPEYRNSLAYAKLFRHRERVIAERNISLQYSFPVDSHFERINGISGTSHYQVPLLIRPLNISRLAKEALPKAMHQFLIGTWGPIAAPVVFRGRTMAAAGDLLMKQAWQYFKKENVRLAGGLALSHTDEYAIMRRAGYIPCPDRFAPKIFHVLHNVSDKSLPDTKYIESRHWFITNVDYFEH